MPVENEVSCLKVKPEPNHDHDEVGIQGCRQHAKNALEAKIKRGKEEVASLETLFRAINWDLLSPQQEELLWRYFIR